MPTGDAAALQAKLQALWESSRGMVLERFETLRASRQRLAEDPRDAAARQSAKEAAHKLAGVLGVFGMPRGSEIGSQIEALLEGEAALTRTDIEALGVLTEEMGAVIAAKTP